MKIVSSSELRPGDVIRFPDINLFGSAVVKAVNDKEVTFMRPYITCCRPEGREPYVDIEEFGVPINDIKRFELHYSL